MRRGAIALVTLVLAVSLGSCGGGWEPSPDPGGSSNWDQMVWDQDFLAALVQEASHEVVDGDAGGAAAGR